MLAATCRSTKERNLFVVALIFSILVWLAIVVTLVGLFYAPFVAIGVVVAHAFALARITGNSIRVGSRQLPDLYKRIETAASKLGLQRMPEVYVMTGGGILNAFATTLFSRSFIVLHSEILDACEAVDEGKGPTEPRAVDFIIGHELGHLALGHLSLNWLLWPAKLLPLLGSAYSRACEYSCDACGLAAVSGERSVSSDDVETAGRALAVLSAGGRQARHVSLDALVEQRHETGSFIMALVELNSTHPYLSKRVAAVQRIHDGGMAPEVGRNPFSYVLAPFFAGATTYLMVYVVVIAAVMASAMPAMMKDLGGAFPFADANTLGGPVALENALDGDDVPPPNLEALLAQLQAQQPDANNGLDNALAGNAFGGLGLGAVPAAAFVDAAGDEGDAGAYEGDEGDNEDRAPRFEARSWLKGQIVAKNPSAVSNMTTAKAAAFVEKLYKSGAAKVWVSDVGVAATGVYANEIIADLPAKPALRKKLVDLCTVEFAKQGFTEPCEDEGVESLWFYWE